MKKSVILALALVGFALSMSAQPKDKYEKYFKDLPFGMQAFSVPTFPQNEVNLKDFRAVGDGKTLCTQAFEQAIEALSRKGGGRLTVPEGVWFTGPIVLKSNINLYVKKGAVILFSPDLSLYPIINTSFEGLETHRCQSPLSAFGAENIAITGRGVIDGNGRWWRPLKKQKVTDSQWKQMTSDGGVFKRADLWYPSEAYAKAAELADLNVPKGEFTAEQWEQMKPFLRPVMISL